MAEVLNVFVPGVAAPQGSKRSVRHRSTGRVVVFDDNAASLKAWRQTIAWEARRAATSGEPLDGPAAVFLAFYLPRGATVTRDLPSVRPDLDKLTRAVFDGLSDARVWVDDGRATDLVVRKRYADAGRAPGARIIVEALGVAS